MFSFLVHRRPIKHSLRKVGSEFGVNEATTKTTQTNEMELTEDDKTVLELIKKQPSMSQREYALELGWTLDRVKYYLRKMKMRKLIKRIGNSHSGYWEVTSEDNATD